ncbi:MAG: AbrB/MazE/SpoVT family DNA-binding domain-containing protein [Candidatus Rokubacteria bacterium]|nr:AbrB/MazE/SpoVT family DNA-binding domain-containing protein [Candidatus Rokubacteria bacterium]
MARGVSVVRVSSKGQIVIPAAVRRTLGLKTGQALAVRTGNGREVVFVPLEQHSAGVEDMLKRARRWAVKSRRDLVEELHRRRRTERARDRARRERRGH